jgi:NifU-like domain
MMIVMIPISTASKLLLLAGACSILSSNAFSPRPTSFVTSTRAQQRFGLFVSTEQEAGAADTPDGGSAPSTPPPVLNGKMVLPVRVVMTGLEGHTLPAVYAVIRSGFARGSDGWVQTEYIGRTTNLYETLQNHISEHGSDKVAHIRALSFSFPQEGAMQSVVNEWTEAAKASGAVLKDWGLVEAQLARMADEDDDDDDDDEWDMDDMPIAVSSSVVDKVISPFASSEEGAATGEALDFTLANVDKVLEEVRPYLISDGGNVSVQKVDLITNQVFLKLEGACGTYFWFIDPVCLHCVLGPQ